MASAMSHTLLQGRLALLALTAGALASAHWGAIYCKVAIASGSRQLTGSKTLSGVSMNASKSISRRAAALRLGLVMIGGS